MQFGLLFKKTSTCYEDPNIEYLDETSLKKMEQQAAKKGISVDEYLEEIKEVSKNVDYMTKEEHGKVYAAGYLRKMLLAPQVKAPEKWNNEVRKTKITEALTDIVQSHGRYRNAIGHKLIFSVSNELQEKVESAGLNLDRVLTKQAKRVMLEFQHKFHPEDQIGYAFGIHHDTDNRHMHIFLSNRSAKGKHVALSNPLKNFKKRSYQQKDQIGYVKQRLVVAEVRIEKLVQKAIDKSEKIKIEDVKIKPQSIQERLRENRKKQKAIGVFKFKDLKEEALLKQEKQLFKKQKEFIQGKHKVRELYTEYKLRKELIEHGLNNLDRINSLINTRYKDIKRIKQPIPTSMLREFGYLSNNLLLKQFAKTINSLTYASDNAMRNSILSKINTSKEIKQRIVAQVKLQKQERNRFLDMIKQVKIENARKAKEFYKNLYEYRRNLDRHNLQKFLDNAKNSSIKYEYFAVFKSLNKKKANGQDFSKETDYLFHMKKYINSLGSKSSTSENFVKSTYSHTSGKPAEYISLKERGQRVKNRVSSNSILNRNKMNDKGVSYE